MNTNYKVLMTLMGLNIGGAETHVLELSKALARRGVTVYVASNGGDYESELMEAGIKHYKAPLDTKHPLSMLQSYRILKKIIIENDIKLVHAHARIPAFLCGLLQKRLRFRFATTAHWVFSTAFPYKMLANWGERSLAVSDDIKNYLITNYKIPKEHIFVTVNGIDTKKFSPVERMPGVVLKPLRILITGRLDKSRSLSTRMAIEAAEEIYKFNPNIEIISVGSGDDFDEIKVMADKVNKRLGVELIKLPGKSTDVEKFLAEADIFIGVSRSALEAMAMALPCIIAGNEGYIGIFDGTEAKLKEAIDTNFCCRGCSETTAEKLRDDVIRLIGMQEDERNAMGGFGREIVIKLYSAERMADDALAMYESLRKPNKKIDLLIMGYYGSRNNGDDVLLKAIIDNLREAQPGLAIEVISTRPKETEAIYGVKSVYKMNLPGIFKKLKQTRLFLLGGGTLIQDLTSSRSLIYYLFAINSAVKLGAKTMLFSNGIGPVLRDKNKPRVKQALNNVDIITLRDPASADVLKDLGVDRPPVHITADIAFCMKVTDATAGSRKLAELGLKKGKQYFCVSIRQWKTLDSNFEQVIAEFVEYVVKKYKLVPIFIVMQPEFDGDIARHVRQTVKSDSYLLDASCGINELLGIVGGARFLLGMRLHAIIYAAMFGVPSIGLVYDPKVQAFLDMVGQTYYTDVAGLQEEVIIKFVDNLMKNRDEISLKINDAVKGIKKLAQRNTALALELLNSDSDKKGWF